MEKLGETRGGACLRPLLSLNCLTCDRDTIQFVMFTVCMFTFVAASRGSLYDSIAFLLILTSGRSG